MHLDDLGGYREKERVRAAADFQERTRSSTGRAQRERLSTANRWRVEEIGFETALSAWWRLGKKRNDNSCMLKPSMSPAWIVARRGQRVPRSFRRPSPISPSYFLTSTSKKTLELFSFFFPFLSFSFYFPFFLFLTESFAELIFPSSHSLRVSLFPWWREKGVVYWGTGIFFFPFF